jgi:hypothetical protein
MAVGTEHEEVVELPRGTSWPRRHRDQAVQRSGKVALQGCLDPADRAGRRHYRGTRHPQRAQQAPHTRTRLHRTTSSLNFLSPSSDGMQSNQQQKIVMCDTCFDYCARERRHWR